MFRQARARLPRFAAGISVVNVKAAKAVLQKYNYTGPIALSWDDTELEPALSVYQESKESILVLGGINGPERFRTMDDVDVFFEKAQFNKADKVNLCSSPVLIHMLI